MEHNEESLNKYFGLVMFICWVAILFTAWPLENVFYGVILGIICTGVAHFTRYNRRSGRIFVGLIICTVILGVIGNNMRDEEIAVAHQKYVAEQISSYEDNYNNAVAILDKKYCNEKDYETARGLLDVFRRTPDDKELADAVLSYKDAKVLYDYADAMATYEGHDSRVAMDQYKRALDKFEAIPPKYVGVLADKIAENHLMVEKDYIQAKGFVEGAAREAAEEKAANIAIGEPEGKITQVLGAPDKVNTSENASGESKQYVYSGNRYVYTVNGVITGMQNISHQY